jgi:ATP-binding cassette subfamily F protein uup
VVVSHDRYLVERACDTVVALFGDGKLTHVPGGIEEYLARRVAIAVPQRGRGSASAAGARDVENDLMVINKPIRSPQVRSRQVRPGSAEQRAARKEAARLERRLDALTEREKQLHAALAEAATDAARLLALDAELRAVVAERESVELDWLAAAELAE